MSRERPGAGAWRGIGAGAARRRAIMIPIGQVGDTAEQAFRGRMRLAPLDEPRTPRGVASDIGRPGPGGTGVPTMTPMAEAGPDVPVEAGDMDVTAAFEVALEVPQNAGD